MHRFLLVAYCLLHCLAAAGQTFFVDTRQLPIQQYQALEKRLHSVRLPDNRIWVMGAEFNLGPGQEYVRARTDLHFRPIVRYTYSLPDSVVRMQEITIDSSKFLGTSYDAVHSYREAPTRYPQFLNAYAQLEQELEAKLGKPTQQQPAHKVTTALSETYQASASWDTPALNAALSLVFTIATKAPVASTERYSVSASNTYRVRADIRYKNPTRLSSLPENKVSNPKQVAVAEQFIGLLLTGKLAESWKLLGPDITQSMTLEQYKSNFTAFIAKLTKPEQGASLLMSGPSFTGDGKLYALYAFKLNSDQNSPPNTLITVVFKDLQTELISGIQPRTRLATVPSPAAK